MDSALVGVRLAYLLSVFNHDSIILGQIVGRRLLYISVCPTNVGVDSGDAHHGVNAAFPRTVLEDGTVTGVALVAA